MGVPFRNVMDGLVEFIRCERTQTPSALFIFHKSKMGTEAESACVGISALFRQYFLFPVNPRWRLRWRTQNTLQWCGLGVRRAARVEVTRKGLRRVSRIRVKDRTPG